MNSNKLILALGVVLASTIPPACGGAESETGQETGGDAQAAEKTEAEGAGPRIASADPVHNYGSVKEGEVVEHVFTIRNTGTQDLHIERAKGS